MPRTLSIMFTVDLVRPVNGIPTDLPSKDRLRLTSLYRLISPTAVAQSPLSSLRNALIDSSSING